MAKKTSKNASPSKPSKVKNLSKEVKLSMNAKPAEGKKPLINDTNNKSSKLTPSANRAATASTSMEKSKTTPKKSAQESSKTPTNSPKMSNFLKKQHERLLYLKDVVLDSMNAVAKDTLRVRAEGSEANAFGMHQADAGSDAYDRDFALSILSQEQNSLYEIDEALKRIENGSYGICEISGKKIPQARLEALPFTRYTVECQAELEKQNRYKARQPVTSLFNLSEDESSEDEDSSGENKD